MPHLVSEQFYNLKIEFNSHFLVIGETHFAFPLMVSYLLKDHDKVFVYDRQAAKLVCIADNIFDYFMNIILKPKQTKLPDKKTIQDLHIRWGEDYWRVK